MRENSRWRKKGVFKCMIKKGKICTFEIEIQGKMERFSIYGKYTIETGKDDSLCDYKYLEFEDIVATKDVGM